MKNAAALCARLSALPDKAARLLSRAALEAARAAAAEARTLSPVRTGALRASISASSLPRGAAAAASVPYAGFVEKKQPYLAPALEQADYAARAARALKEGLL